MRGVLQGIDLSGLSDGGAGVGYPVTADVSDTAGNPAPTATRPITLTGYDCTNNQY